MGQVESAAIYCRDQLDGKSRTLDRECIADGPPSTESPATTPSGRPRPAANAEDTPRLVDSYMRALAVSRTAVGDDKDWSPKPRENGANSTPAPQPLPPPVSVRNVAINTDAQQGGQDAACSGQAANVAVSCQMDGASAPAPSSASNGAAKGATVPKVDAASEARVATADASASHEPVTLVESASLTAQVQTRDNGTDPIEELAVDPAPPSPAMADAATSKGVETIEVAAGTAPVEVRTVGTTTAGSEDKCAPTRDVGTDSDELLPALLEELQAPLQAPEPVEAPHSPYEPFASPPVSMSASRMESTSSLPSTSSEVPANWEERAFVLSPSTSGFRWDRDRDEFVAGVTAWVHAVTELPLPADLIDEPCVHSYLKSGVVLCELANRLQPGIVTRIQHSTAPFPQRENIGNFLDAAAKLGVQGHEMFQTGDLFNGRDMKQVCVCIGALGRAAYNITTYEGLCYGKPVKARLGAHRQSSFKVQTGEGLWGKAAGQHRPNAGPAKGMGSRSASATGFSLEATNASPSRAQLRRGSSSRDPSPVTPVGR